MGTACDHHESGLPEAIFSTDGRVRAIESISDECSNDALVKRYAEFKLGAPEAREEFLNRLARLVIADLGERLTRYHWYLATAATMELIQDFRQILGQSIGRSRITLLPVGPDPLPESDYSGCNQAERLRKVHSFLDIRQLCLVLES